jgi:predicted transcriptional regulator
MPGRNRCYYDLIYDALNVATEPIHASDLFWKARISGRIYAHVKTDLFNAGLLELVHNPHAATIPAGYPTLLHTTDKGKNWIRVFKSLKKLMEKVNDDGKMRL